MDCISNFKSTKEDHIHEEKVLHFTDYVTSQPESSTQKSDQPAANKPTSSKVVKEDFFRSSKVLDEEEGLDKYLANKISIKDESKRILDDELFEHANQSLPLTAAQALKFQGRAKHFFGPRPTQRNDGMLVKTGKVQITSLNTQGKHSIEAERKDNLLLFRNALGNKEMESQRNRSEISDLSLSLPLPLETKRKVAERKRREKPHNKTWKRTTKS